MLLKICESFAVPQKQKRICNIYVLNFNKTLTNDIVNIEQPGPGLLVSFHSPSPPPALLTDCLQSGCADLCQMLHLGLFQLVGTGALSSVCCLVHRGSTDDLPLLKISSGVVSQSRDLQLSRNTLYLFRHRLCFFIV